jgi:pre-rRNA-processing protein TSR1
MDTGEIVLAMADSSKQVSLQSELIPDPMESEQPDPSEDAEPTCNITVIRFLYFNLVKVPKLKKKKVPKGTSDYQAEWILDDDEEDQNDKSGDENEVRVDLLILSHFIGR